MGAIIRMTSSEFLKKFCKKYNYKHYNFILVSSDIKNNKKHGNVYSIQALMPPTKALTKLFEDGDKKSYLRMYYKHLASGNVEMYVTTLVKLCVMENTDVILLCSDEENEYKYLKGLCNYIENIYDAPTYTFKEYDKKPKKCNSSKNKKQTVKVIKKKINAYREFAKSTEPVNLTKKEMKARLELMDKPTLIHVCKNNGIKYKGKSRSELFKALCKRL